MRPLASAGAAVIALLAPAAALACPVCAQRPEGGLLRTVALGVLIVSPWIAASCIGLWIRRGLRSESRHVSSSQASSSAASSSQGSGE